MAYDPAYEQWLQTRGLQKRLIDNENERYAWFDQNGNQINEGLINADPGRDAFLPGEQTYNLANLYQQSQNPLSDQAGNNPWGTMGGLFGGQSGDQEYGRPNIAADSPYTTFGGRRVVRTGMSHSDLDRALNAYGAQTDLPENLGGYDPAIGYYYDADRYDQAKAAKDQQFSAQNNGFDVFSFGPLLVAAGWGAMIASAAAAAGGAAGVSGGFGGGLGGELAYGAPEFAGQFGLDGAATLGASNPNYWNMLADAGGTTTDALPAGAVDMPGAGFDFSSTYLPTGNPLSAFSPGGGGVPGFSPVSIGGNLPYTGGTPISGGTSLSDILGGLKNVSSVGQLVSGLGSLGNAAASYFGGQQAANASKAATDAQLGIFNTINAQQAPYRGAGYAALASLLGGADLGPAVGGVSQGQFTHQFDANDLKTNLAPNYQFQLDQGLGAVRNQMNATGGQQSGNLLKGINDYAQNYAGGAYQNAFNNYNANQTNIFNRLSSIAGFGQTANQSVASTGAAMSPGIANSITNTGAAQAAGTIGVGNALTQGANNAFGWYALPDILNQARGTYTGSANA